MSRCVEQGRAMNEVIVEALCLPSRGVSPTTGHISCENNTLACSLVPEMLPEYVISLSVPQQTCSPIFIRS